METREEIALLVAGLAAFASLVSAGLAVFNGWRDNRALHISIVPDPWHNSKPSLESCVVLRLTLVNLARSSNSIVELTCQVDGKEQHFTTDPVDLLEKSIKAFGAAQGLLVISSKLLPDNFRKIKFLVRDGHGRRRRFKFRKEQVLPAF